MLRNDSALSRAADALENGRDRWINDPVGWVERRLAGHLWSRQADVARLLVDHKRVAVRSAHACGKTWLAAAMACWFVDTRPPGEALVISSAPSYAQVHGVLWEEIRRIHRAAGLDGVVLGSDQWQLADGTLVGLGRRPADHNQLSLQGYHRKHVLVVLDEAAGIPAWMWTAIETVTTSPHCRLLAISNPDDRTSEFARISTSDPSWKSVRISAFDSPAYTDEQIPPQLRELLVSREWVEDKRTRWTEESPLWRAKVEAEFADADDGLIPYSWVQAANRRWDEWNDNPNRDTEQPHGRRVFGCDPAWLGADRTAIATRQGHVVMSVDAYQGLDTTQVAGLVEAKLRGTPQSTAVVDVIGIGTGVVDQLRRAGCNVQAFNGSRATRRTDASGEWRHPNLRSASWWHLRELLDPNLGGRLALPTDDDLAAELCAPRYEFRSGGMLHVESKDDTKKRIGRSPDMADAVVYACWSELGDAHRDYQPATTHRTRSRRYRNTYSSPGSLDQWDPRPGWK